MSAAARSRKGKKSAKPSLGWVGAGGRMGFAMAKRLIAAGTTSPFTTARAARSSRSRKPARDRRLGRGPARVRHRVHDRVHIRRSDRGLPRAQRPAEQVGSPKLIVDCSSVSEEASAKVRAEAEKLGTQMLAAPVSGNAKVVSAGKLTIVASGPRKAFDLAQPYLAALGQGVTYVGEGELARMVKICHNLLLGVIAQSLAESRCSPKKAAFHGTRSSSSSTTASSARCSRATRRPRS